jgi:hypothetical protein
MGVAVVGVDYGLGSRPIHELAIKSLHWGLMMITTPQEGTRRQLMDGPIQPIVVDLDFMDGSEPTCPPFEDLGIRGELMITDGCDFATPRTKRDLMVT